MRGWCVAGAALLGLAAGGPAAAQGFVLLSDLQDRYPTWDAATERVWFNSNRTGIDQLWTVAADGSGPRMYPAEGHREVVPDVGPDGRVAYVRYVGENEEIFLLDPESGRRVPLASDPGADSDPSWSPDGSRVWFSSNRDGNWSIWSAPVNGSEVCKETHAAQRDALPRVSPDGRWLAFQRTMARTDAEIWVKNLETGEERNVSNWSGGWDGWPSWAPDSRSILFGSNRGGGDMQLWAVGLEEGDTARAVTAIPGLRLRRAHWLPDGRRILTNVERANDPTVLAMILQSSSLLMTAQEAGRNSGGAHEVVRSTGSR